MINGEFEDFEYISSLVNVHFCFGSIITSSANEPTFISHRSIFIIFAGFKEKSLNIDSILKFILDFDNSYKWMYRLEDSKILEKSNDTLFYVYFKMEMGWPLKKRDLVSDVKILSEDNRVTVNLTSTPGYIPLDKNLIRILDSKSTWILSKIDSNKTKVTLQSYAEIDKIPSFVVDMFILDGPLHSMKNLRKNF